MNDLWLACVHEAGHLFALEHFGGSGHIEIRKNSSEIVDEYSYLGRVIVTKPPAPPHDEAAVIIGLAGHCAELADDEPSDWLSHDLEDFWYSNQESISESDLKLTKGLKECHFLTCANLIEGGLKQIQFIANQTMESITC